MELHPLYLAAHNGHAKVVQILCRYNADINKADDGGRATPLHRAAEHGHEKVVEILCKYKANVNQADVHGYTPPHEAAYNNKKQIIIDLVFFFSKRILSVKNNQHQTALDLAQALGKDEIVELLSDETLLDQEVEKRREEFLKQEMQENCLSLNPLAFRAGREVGRTPLQIKLEQKKMKEFKESAYRNIS